MILIGIGANLPSPQHGSPRETCVAALKALEAKGVATVRHSRWYRSAPVPASSQPWYVNGVARVETTASPEALMALLHEVERAFGRVRGERDAARVLDLDLLAYGALVRTDGPPPHVPHPRLENRAFVLLPLAEVAPVWRHPVSGRSLDELIAALPPEQVALPIVDETPPEPDRASA